MTGRAIARKANHRAWRLRLRERLCVLVSRLSAGGISTFTLGPLQWSINEAEALVAEEEAEMRKMHEMLARVEAERAAMTTMLQQQQALHRQLSELAAVPAH